MLPKSFIQILSNVITFFKYVTIKLCAGSIVSHEKGVRRSRPLLRQCDLHPHKFVGLAESMLATEASNNHACTVGYNFQDRKARTIVDVSWELLFLGSLLVAPIYQLFVSLTNMEQMLGQVTDNGLHEYHVSTGELKANS